MATRRTRTKGRQTPKAAGARQQVNRASGKKLVATPAGCKPRKPTKEQKANVANKPNTKNKVKKNTPARQTTSKSTTVSNTKGTPDAYEFDETDDFISGSSSLSTSCSAHSAHKMSMYAPFTKTVPKKKGKTTNLQKGKMAQQDNLLKSVSRRRCKGGVSRYVEEDEKKTSTPVVVESSNGASKSKAQQEIADGKLRRSPRVTVPKLDLDFSVTPILPVFTPISPKQRAKKDNDASYVAAPKPQVTPHIPAEKSERRKTRRQSAQSSFSTPSQGSASVMQPQATSVVSTVSEKKDLKRKRSQSSPPKSMETEHSAAAKRQKADHQKAKQGAQPSKPQKQVSKKLTNCPKQPKKSSKKEAPSKQTPDPYKRDSLSTKSLQQRTGTQITTPQRAEPASVWEPGKEKMYCVVTPYLHDSGISMGSDTSTSRMVGSSTSSLPGFMEEEPFQSELQDFSSSPSSLPKTDFSFEPVPTLNRSSSIAYKPRNTKREKGRYSASKMDAWADMVNQDMQDVESFELVVE